MLDCGGRHAYSSYHARQQEDDIEDDERKPDLCNELVPAEVLA